MGVVLALLETIGCGAILLDEHGSVIELNENAERLKEGVRVQHQRLQAIDAGSNRKLQKLLKKISAASPGRGGQSVTIPRPGRRPLALRILPIAQSCEPLHEGAHAIVLVFDPEDSPKPDASLVRQVFGLTPAEWRIAERLIDGDSLDDIATALGVSLSTVRTQLKSIFAKTQSHRQTELVASLMQLTSHSSGSNRRRC